MHPKNAAIPKLFIIGDRDTFTSVSSFQKFIAQVSSIVEEEAEGGGERIDNTVESVIVKNVDHFWHHQERFVTNAINEFLEKWRFM